MKTHRLGLLAAAIAAVALVGCDDDSSDGLGSVKITEDNQEAIAEAGLELAASGMDISSEFDSFPTPAPVGVVVGGGGSSNSITLIQLGNLIHEHRQAAAIAAITSPTLPVGAAVEGEAIDCPASGSYTVAETASTWGVTYNACAFEDSNEDDSYVYRYEFNGTVNGIDINPAGYGGWENSYENLRYSERTVLTDYVTGEDEQTGSITYGFQIDGLFRTFNANDGYGGNYASHYQAEDLVIRRTYKATGDLIDGEVPKDKGYDEEDAGILVYETYDFTYTNTGGYQYWDGELVARDSDYGLWSVIANDFGTSYCSGVVGNIRYTGRVDDEGESTGANVLVITGDGGIDVLFRLLKADGTELNSESVDWYTGCAT